MMNTFTRMCKHKYTRANKYKYNFSLSLMRVLQEAVVQPVCLTHTTSCAKGLQSHRHLHCRHLLNGLLNGRDPSASLQTNYGNTLKVTISFFCPIHSKSIFGWHFFFGAGCTEKQKHKNTVMNTKTKFKRSVFRHSTPFGKCAKGVPSCRHQDSRHVLNGLLDGTPSCVVSCVDELALGGQNYQCQNGRGPVIVLQQRCWKK